MTHEAQAFYNPSTGRWLSRDPLAEKGGVNLCGFVANQPISLADPLGTCPADIVAGHALGYLAPLAAKNSTTRDVVYVGCMANKLNGRWSQITDYPKNQMEIHSWPPTYNDGKVNTNAPAHGPGWPDVTDDDYLFADDAPGMIDSAINAIKKALCKRDCCAGNKVHITITCQPLGQAEIDSGVQLHRSCGKTIEVRCDGTPN